MKDANIRKLARAINKMRGGWPSTATAVGVQIMLEEILKDELEAQKLKKNPLLQFSPKRFDQPRNCEVEVCRTGFGNSNITVLAVSERDAAEKAWDLAGNESFNEHDSEYEVMGVAVGDPDPDPDLKWKRKMI